MQFVPVTGWESGDLGRYIIGKCGLIIRTMIRKMKLLKLGFKYQLLRAPLHVKFDPCIKSPRYLIKLLQWLLITDKVKLFHNVYFPLLFKTKMNFHTGIKFKCNPRDIENNIFKRSENNKKNHTHWVIMLPMETKDAFLESKIRLFLS